MEDIKTAVVTGCHPFDVQAFHKLFRRMRGVDAYIQHMEEFATTPRKVREQYDVVLFYNMHRSVSDATTRTAIEELGETEQGIVVLHHGLIAFRDWGLWSEIVGIRDRSSTPLPDQRVRLQIADARHPITVGINSWEMIDEVYTAGEPDPGSRVLIRTDHRRSMESIAWVRNYKASRVFCFQSGHDEAAYSNVSFREVLARGIRWCARVL